MSVTRKVRYLRFLEIDLEVQKQNILGNGNFSITFPAVFQEVNLKDK
jgi:hypothetical protein